MNRITVHQQIHGYQKGHQLLSSTVKLSQQDQDTIDRLSDVSGPLRPREAFQPYLTAYPLPGRDYYVLGRTFQDNNAPRSGCVITKSVLISLDDWGTLDAFDGILANLRRPVVEYQISEITIPLRSTPPDRLADIRLLELVEYLFFEKPQPIVFFGTQDAEPIAIRLLMSLWPAMKRNFSLCTYALAPRTVGDSYFDLVFSPVRSRSRFANLPGKRIGPTPSLASHSIHRLVKPTASLIFQSDTPSLVATDILGVLSIDDREDPGALRMLLLWNELASRAHESPTALLGMLDLLNARGDIDRHIWQRLSPIFRSVIHASHTKLSETAIWQFLIALEVKANSQAAPDELLCSIEEEARIASQQGAQHAIRVFEDVDFRRDSIPARVLKGLAVGISESRSLVTLPDDVVWFPTDLLLRMMDLSNVFVLHVVDIIAKGNDVWIDLVLRAFASSDSVTKRRVGSTLLSELADRAPAEAIPVLLAQMTGQDIVDITLEIGRRTGFLGGTLENALILAAQRSGTVESIRDAVITRFDGVGADRFILASLEVCTNDLDWLTKGVDSHTKGIHDHRRRIRLLGKLLSSADDDQISQVCSKGIVSAVLLTLSSGDLKETGPEIARILLLCDVDAEQTLRLGFAVLPHIGRSRTFDLGIRLLYRSLSGSVEGNRQTLQLLEVFGQEVGVGELIEWATDNGIHTARVANNIVAFNSAPSITRDGIVTNIDELTRKLIARPREDLGEPAYAAWSELIRHAKGRNRHAFTSAARMALPFAIRLVQYPVSTLILETFAVVYYELATRGGIRKYDWLWTHPHSRIGKKRVRKKQRQLVNQLVDAFLKAKWPAADLFVIAIGVGVEMQVVKRIRKKGYDGGFLDAVERDSDRLGDSMRLSVLRCLRQYG